MLNFNICRNLSCISSLNSIKCVYLTLNWEPLEACIHSEHRYNTLFAFKKCFLGQSHFYRFIPIRLFSEMKPPITLCMGNFALSVLHSPTSPSCFFLTVLQNSPLLGRLPWPTGLKFKYPLSKWYVWIYFYHTTYHSTL